MAKQKKPLSPEKAEIKAIKKEYKSKRWTKFWAVVLALVLAAGVVVLGNTSAKKAVENAGGASAGTATNAPTSDADLNKNDVQADVGEELGSGEDGAEGGDGVTKENIHEKFNEWTAAAAKGSYKFTRVCQYTPDGAIDVGNATSTLDKVIKAVDSNASLGSVVGGFIGIGNREGEVQNGQIPEDMKADYVLKAMQLTAADIKGSGKDGNTYKVQINACANPKKDNSNALSRATNDFFTHEEVVEGITSLTSAIKVEGTNVEYTEIVLAATVENGQMTKLEISYTFAATMNLKVAVVGIEGKGKATNVLTYTIG